MNRTEFEAKLNEVYKGAVKPLTSYVSEHATLVFQCDKCGLKFFGKPNHMIGKEHQQHKCNYPYGDINGERFQIVSSSRNKRKKNSSKATSERFYEMVINDYTPKEIAKELDIPLVLVMDYFNKEGLI
ncbi:adenylate kinase [Bacillus xiamenensis]|uniref:Adenylate kinase n=1 Tax=Bacillus xiamenensis TaxID=1178537 RepID=A0AAC9IHF3_9BACI|nr:adenylate kinase [Bacillus xiamenensis]AOZ89326.1 adenylate kinase [Bacillus xiamenensis]